MKRFFYGWIIVAISTLALTVSNGLAIYGMPVFSEWIRNEFIASGAMPSENAQSIVANFGVLVFLVSGFSAPFGGYIIQKASIKKLMLLGCVMLGAAVLVNSQATAVWQVYLCRMVMGASLSFIGVLINTVLVSNWFVKKRGVALGIVLCGTSLGGFFIPQIATPLIKAYGWRWAMALISLFVWVILIPAVIFLVRSKPSEIGIGPDDMPLATTEAKDDAALNEVAGLTLLEAIRTPIFWVFSVTAALVFYPLFVVTQQLILYLRSGKIGMSPESAAWMISTMSLLIIAGKFGFGFLSDRFSPTFVMLLCCLVMFAATLVFLNFSSGVVLLFLIPFGLGYGGTFVLLQRLIADYFGMRDYAKILGLVTVIETIGASIGGRVTGAVADLDGGDYTKAFYLVVVASGAALALTLILNLINRRYTGFQQLSA